MVMGTGNLEKSEGSAPQSYVCRTKKRLLGARDEETLEESSQWMKNPLIFSKFLFYFASHLQHCKPLSVVYFLDCINSIFFYYDPTVKKYIRADVKFTDLQMRDK